MVAKSLLDTVITGLRGAAGENGFLVLPRYRAQTMPAPLKKPAVAAGLSSMELLPGQLGGDGTRLHVRMLFALYVPAGLGGDGCLVPLDWLLGALFDAPGGVRFTRAEVQETTFDSSTGAYRIHVYADAVLYADETVSQSDA